MSKSGPVGGAATRATWDYKGRLQDMEQLALFLQHKAASESTQLTVCMHFTRATLSGAGHDEGHVRADHPTGVAARTGMEGRRGMAAQNNMTT